MGSLQAVTMAEYRSRRPPQQAVWMVATGDAPNRTWFCSGGCYRTGAQQRPFGSIIVRCWALDLVVPSETGGSAPARRLAYLK